MKKLEKFEKIEKFEKLEEFENFEKYKCEIAGGQTRLQEAAAEFRFCLSVLNYALEDIIFTLCRFYRRA